MVGPPPPAPVTTYSHFFWSYLLAGGRRWRWPFAIGAVVPDLVYIPLMARVLFEHGAGSWGDLARWDAAAAHPLTLALHSFVPAGLALPGAALAGGTAAVAVLAGVLSHALVDMLTHVSDAYPVLWPLSDARFPAAVSYYEPQYNGRAFFLAEHLALGLGVLFLAGRAARRRWRAHPRRATRSPGR